MKEAAEHNLVSDIKHCLTSPKLEQVATKLLNSNSNRHERIELWAKSIKYLA